MGEGGDRRRGKCFKEKGEKGRRGTGGGGGGGKKTPSSRSRRKFFLTENCGRAATRKVDGKNLPLTHMCVRTATLLDSFSLRYAFLSLKAKLLRLETLCLANAIHARLDREKNAFASNVSFSSKILQGQQSLSCLKKSSLISNLSISKFGSIIQRKMFLSPPRLVLDATETSSSSPSNDPKRVMRHNDRRKSLILSTEI